jgi:hypothetical protein
MSIFVSIFILSIFVSTFVLSFSVLSISVLSICYPFPCPFAVLFSAIYFLLLMECMSYFGVHSTYPRLDYPH